MNNFEQTSIAANPNDTARQCDTAPTVRNISEMSDVERWEYFVSMVGNKAPHAGRPRKDDPDRVKWSDFGFTRQQIWRFRRLAEIPETVRAEYMADCRSKERPASYRGLFVASGKINVIDENVFDDTTLGELAAKILGSVELILRDMTKPQRRAFIMALRSRLKQAKRNVACEGVGHE